MPEFECHNVPKNIEKELQNFLSILGHDDTLFYYYKKLQPHFLIFEINFLSELEIQKLNKEFRKINMATDVLSFQLENVGEIDLCLPIIKMNSEDLGEDFVTELQRCIIHGVLHTLGMDHESKLIPNQENTEPMFISQEQILQKCRTR